MSVTEATHYRNVEKAPAWARDGRHCDPFTEARAEGVTAGVEACLRATESLHEYVMRRMAEDAEAEQAIAIARAKVQALRDGGTR